MRLFENTKKIPIMKTSSNQPVAAVCCFILNVKLPKGCDKLHRTDESSDFCNFSVLILHVSSELPSGFFLLKGKE
jgi:hypothetical protein